MPPPVHAAFVRQLPRTATETTTDQGSAAIRRLEGYRIDALLAAEGDVDEGVLGGSYEGKRGLQLLRALGGGGGNCACPSMVGSKATRCEASGLS